MEHPHKLYLLYLASKRMNGYEMRADCVMRNLLPPNDEDIQEIVKDLGPVPGCWRATVQRKNVAFRRWLRNRGIQSLWVHDDATIEALALVTRRAVRKDFEAIVLAHGDIARAHKELLLKYTEGIVPSMEGLKRFYEIFWNVGAMSPDGIYEYIQASQDKEDYLPAVQGDLVQTYATLGLNQRISQEALLSTIVAAGMVTARRVAREGDTMGGQTAAGLSAVMTLAMKAGQLLEDQHVDVEGDNVIRRDAADFMVRVVQRVAIPSIDELDHGGVIDAEFAEVGADNVHRLPARD